VSKDDLEECKTDYANNMVSADVLILFQNLYIMELEEMLKPKKCSTCKYFTEQKYGFNYCDMNPYINGFIHKFFGCINHEEKELK